MFSEALLCLFFGWILWLLATGEVLVVVKVASILFFILAGICVIIGLFGIIKELFGY